MNTRRAGRGAILLAIPLLAAALARCVDAVGPSAPPALLQVVSGNDQTALVGQELEEEIVVRVLAAAGEPVRGALVLWEAGPDAGEVRARQERTAADGTARAVWKLGTKAGPQRATVEVAGLDPIELTAVAIPGAPASLVVEAGNGQSGEAGAILGSPLVVRVIDEYGNGVPGVEVQWSVVAGGGEVTPPVSVTATDGTASATWALGPGEGIHEARATVAGLPPVSFFATSVVLVPASLEIVGGDGQSGPAGAPLPQPLAVRVRDPGGSPIAGVEVAWTVEAGGGSISPATSTTGPDGVATTTWTLGSEPGTGIVTAAVAGLAPVQFTSTALAPVGSVRIEPRAAAPRVGEFVELSALLFDAGGSPLPGGRSLAWSSSNPDVVAVQSDGRAFAFAPGAVFIRVSVEGKSDSIPVVVPAPGITRVWLGTDAGAPGAWSAAASWSPAGAPGAEDRVWIPAAIPIHPVLDGEARVRSIAVDAGTRVELAGHALRVGGSVVADGPISGDGELVLEDHGVLAGTVPATVIADSVALAGPATAASVSVRGGGFLDLAGETLRVLGDFEVLAGPGTVPYGRVRMTAGTDTLIVHGNALFAGASEITGGVLRLRGNLAQTVIPDALTAPALAVVLEGDAPQTISIHNGGPDGSHVGDVRVANEAGVIVARNFLAHGDLTVSGRLVVNAGQTLEAANLFLLAGGRIENNGTIRHNGLFIDHGGTVEGNAPEPGIELAELDGGTPVPVAAGAGASLYYVIEVPEQVAILRVQTSGGSGDLDLFVRGARLPTPEEHRCASTGPGNDETCEINNPAPGFWFVLVRGAEEFDGATLRAELDPGDGFNLHVAGVHITQGTQTFAGDVPLVAGRDGYLRVFVTASEPRDVAPRVRVWYYRYGRVVRTDYIPAPTAGIPTTVDGIQGTWEATYNVLVPGALLEPGLAVHVDVDPDDLVPEADRSDNVFPREGVLALDVRRVPSFVVRLVPIRHTRSNGEVLTGNVTEENKDYYVSFARQVFPFHEVDVTVGPVYSMDPGFRLGGAGSGGLASWLQVLNELAAAYVIDGADEHYYGVINAGYTNGYAGLGQIGKRAAVGWDGNHANVIAAHEWGHNFGRLHARCPGNTNPGDVDGGYPYLNGTIGQWGVRFDGGPTLVRPDDAHDVMSYCFNTAWVSDYTYRAVLEYREAQAAPPAMLAAAGAAVLPEAAPAEPLPRQPTLVVWGRIDGDSLTLEPALRVETVPALPREPGPYRLEGFDHDGRSLFTLDFAGTEVAGVPDHRQFAFAIPEAWAPADRLARIRLSSATGAVEWRAAPAAGRAAAPPVLPTPAARRTAAGHLELEWSPDASRLVVVRDATTGRTISIARSGRVILPDARGEVEVVVSDGVRSATRRVSAAR